MIVKESQTGFGVFATQSYKLGDVVAEFPQVFTHTPTRFTVQVGEDRHIITEGTPLLHLNHSCNPNTKIVDKTFHLVAIKPVEEGEELTFNYLATEWILKEPFSCQCPSEGCFGQIRGFAFLTPDARLRLIPLLLDYLRTHL